MLVRQPAILPSKRKDIKEDIFQIGKTTTIRLTSKIIRLLRKISVLRHNEGLIKVPYSIKPLNTIVLGWSEEFQEKSSIGHT